MPPRIDYDEYGNLVEVQDPEPGPDPDRALREGIMPRSGARPVEVQDPEPGPDPARALREGIMSRYREYLGRTPSEEEIAIHTQNPNGLPGVGAAIAASNEYQARRQAPSGPSATVMGGPGDPAYDANPRDYMANRDQAMWQSNLLDYLVRVKGVDPVTAGRMAQEEVLGVVRAATNARNAGVDPAVYIDAAKARLNARLGNTPAGTTPAPSTTATPSPTTTAPTSTALTTKKAANILPQSTSVYTRTPVVTTTPYSAARRVTAPTLAPVAAPVVANPYRGTAASLMAPAPATPTEQTAQTTSYETNPAWLATDQLYREALNGASASPWAGVRESLARGPRQAVSGTLGADRWRQRAAQQPADQFGQQVALDAQRNAALGQQDFTNQMDRWTRAYDDWNRRGQSVPGAALPEVV